MIKRLLSNTWIDYALGYVTGKLLVWAGKRAVDRGDMHEASHILGALNMGITTECGENLEDCPIDYGADDEVQSEADTDILGSIHEFDLEGWLHEL